MGDFKEYKPGRDLQVEGKILSEDQYPADAWMDSARHRIGISLSILASHQLRDLIMEMGGSNAGFFLRLLALYEDLIEAGNQGHVLELRRNGKTVKSLKIDELLGLPNLSQIREQIEQEINKIFKRKR